MMTHDREDEMAARAAVWRAHIEAWRRGDVSQRAYCEAHRLSRKSFTNWRQRFREEELRIERKARRRGKYRALQTRESGAELRSLPIAACPSAHLSGSQSADQSHMSVAGESRIRRAR
jgi:hypothetical protein